MHHNHIHHEKSGIGIAFILNLLFAIFEIFEVSSLIALLLLPMPFTILVTLFQLVFHGSLKKSQREDGIQNSHSDTNVSQYWGQFSTPLYCLVVQL